MANGKERLTSLFAGLGGGALGGALDGYSPDTKPAGIPLSAWVGAGLAMAGHANVGGDKASGILREAGQGALDYSVGVLVRDWTAQKMAEQSSTQGVGRLRAQKLMAANALRRPALRMPHHAYNSHYVSPSTWRSNLHALRSYG